MGARDLNHIYLGLNIPPIAHCNQGFTLYKNIAGVLLCLILLSGCVAYPTTRTYFKPDLNDGQLTPSMGCGYHTTRDDAVEKIVGDVTLTVMPEYVSGANLKITLLIRAKSKAGALLPENVFVSSSNFSSKLYPADITVTEQEPSGAIDHFSQWYTLVFPVSVDGIKEFELTIPWNNSSTTRQEDGVLNFSFEKVEVADFYYNSINC
ncbi:hypothetical protein Ssed_2392 [Shewanella sediminis HAW-EB3]|uniref:Uncharacterized protein n=1 Tax=Shewanella sediminis (strain HAW-EB3) TaxID=425104 RepID=A8FVX8_SHESH|nr:hypothetical protein Ssed_2392 [Shewanella sediminis HAW-EB3]